MTNREKFMQMSDEEFANLLCRATVICRDCPVYDRCSNDEEAIVKWLSEENKDDQN